MHLIHYLWRTDVWGRKKSSSGAKPCSTHVILVIYFYRADLERKGMPIHPMDMLIAGHAKSKGVILVTNNTKEFFRVEDLGVEDWTKELQ